MATLDVKFTKFDNRPWGFRLAGGSDFPEPLTVIRVTEGSLAECMGLKVGDVVVKLNDQPITDLTHGQAHEALVLAGNNFVLGVRRTEDPSKTVEGIEDKIEPYMLPIEEILFAPVEEKRESTPDEVSQIQDECAPIAEPEADRVEEVETYPEKPGDENSERVPNTNLTDEEIAQLILDEEEVLNDKGVLGVNFKKLRPRAPLLKESKVFQELVQEVNSDPPQVQELKRQTTFLQKPERPIPKPRSTNSQSEAVDSKPEDTYKVVIKKQPKKSVTERLLEQGLLEPARVKTPESTIQASEVKDELLAPDNTFDATLTTSSDREDEPPTTLTPQIPRIEIIPAEDETIRAMLPISESTIVEESSEACKAVPSAYDAAAYAVKRSVKKPRLCRRGRYAKRCLNRALESLKSPAKTAKPRLLKRARYFERIVSDIGRSLSGSDRDAMASSEDSFLRVLMLAHLANSLRDTYDNEILHRGSSRRNSRRMSSNSRRESNAFEAGLLAFKAKRDAESSFQSKYAEGKRRLSVMSTMVADKVSNAIRTDLARGLAYAMVPCASALAFFMYNYAKRFNNDNRE